MTQTANRSSKSVFWIVLAMSFGVDKIHAWAVKLVFHQRDVAQRSDLQFCFVTTPDKRSRYKAPIEVGTPVACSG